MVAGTVVFEGKEQLYGMQKCDMKLGGRSNFLGLLDMSLTAGASGTSWMGK